MNETDNFTTTLSSNMNSTLSKDFTFFLWFNNYIYNNNFMYNNFYIYSKKQI